MASEKTPLDPDLGVPQGPNTEATESDSKEREKALEKMLAAIYFEIICISCLCCVNKSIPEGDDLDWYRFECKKAEDFWDRVLKLNLDLTYPPVTQFTNRTDERMNTFRHACVEAEQLLWDMLLYSILKETDMEKLFLDSRVTGRNGPPLTQTRCNFTDLHAVIVPLRQLSSEHLIHFVKILNTAQRCQDFDMDHLVQTLTQAQCRLAGEQDHSVQALTEALQRCPIFEEQTQTNTDDFDLMHWQQC